MARSEEPKSDRSLESLNDRFRPKAKLLIQALKAMLAPVGLVLVVSETGRSLIRQQWLWASGRSRTGPILTQKDGVERKSRHQFGSAIDLLIYRAGRLDEGPLPDKAKEWDLIGQEAARLGLRWGGAWGDKPHAEDVLT